MVALVQLCVFTSGNLNKVSTSSFHPVVAIVTVWTETQTCYDDDKDDYDADGDHHGDDGEDDDNIFNHDCYGHYDNGEYDDDDDDDDDPMMNMMMVNLVLMMMIHYDNRDCMGGNRSWLCRCCQGAFPHHPQFRHNMLPTLLQA